MSCHGADTDPPALVQSLTACSSLHNSNVLHTIYTISCLPLLSSALRYLLTYMYICLEYWLADGEEYLRVVWDTGSFMLCFVICHLL